MSDVITAKTSLVEILRALDKEWRRDANADGFGGLVRSYYDVAADRIEELEKQLAEARQATPPP